MRKELLRGPGFLVKRRSVQRLSRHNVNGGELDVGRTAFHTASPAFSASAYYRPSVCTQIEYSNLGNSSTGLRACGTVREFVACPS